ncbi:hypothetical protein OSA16_00625, partial [Treponema pallidum]
VNKYRSELRTCSSS